MPSNRRAHLVVLHDEFSAPYLLSALSRNPGGGSRATVIHRTQTRAIANQAERQPSAIVTRETSVNVRDSLGIAALIRAQRHRDFTATLAEWQRASGTDRAYWRRYVRLHIAEERARLAKSRAALRFAATRARKDAA